MYTEMAKQYFISTYCVEVAFYGTFVKALYKATSWHIFILHIIHYLQVCYV